MNKKNSTEKLKESLEERLDTLNRPKQRDKYIERIKNCVIGFVIMFFVNYFVNKSNDFQMKNLAGYLLVLLIYPIIISVLGIKNKKYIKAHIFVLILTTIVATGLIYIISTGGVLFA